MLFIATSAAWATQKEIKEKLYRTAIYARLRFNEKKKLLISLNN